MLPGMTLLEMMIAMAIMFIGMQGFSMLFLKSWTQNGFILETGMASARASLAVEGMVSEIRKARQADNGGYLIDSGDSFSLTFYEDIDNDDITERVHYYLENGSLKRGVREPTAPPSPTYASGDATVTILADNIDNQGNEPLFYYYGNSYPADTTPLSVPVTVDSVYLVRVRTIVNIDPIHAPNDITIESIAKLRNKQ
jgi:Tfp pilus assembly protein PilE